MASMNYQIAQGQHLPFSIIERNPTLASVPAETVLFLSSDPESVTVVPDRIAADGTHISGYLIGGPKLQNDVKVTATVRRPDGSTSTQIYAFDVVPTRSETSSLSLQVGAPVLPQDAPIAPRPLFMQGDPRFADMPYNDKYPNVQPVNPGPGQVVNRASLR